MISSSIIDYSDSLSDITEFQQIVFSLSETRQFEQQIWYSKSSALVQREMSNTLLHWCMYFITHKVILDWRNWKLETIYAWDTNTCWFVPNTTLFFPLLLMDDRIEKSGQAKLDWSEYMFHILYKTGNINMIPEASRILLIDTDTEL